MKAETQALLERWQTFSGKVRQRLTEVLMEADAGFDQIIAMDVVDPASMSGAVSAFDARIRGLQQKVEQAWEQIDEQLRDRSQLDRRDGLHREQRELAAEIGRAGRQMSILKRAAAAQRLWEIASAEMAQPQYCVNCGAQLEAAVKHTAINETCASCGAVNSLRPGTATTYLFYGNGIHALAEQAALGEWIALEQEELRHEGLRSPSAADVQRLEAATRSYWEAYCSAMGRMHPDWTPEQVQAEVAGKMGSFHSFYRS